MRKLVLEFIENNSSELVEVRFVHPLAGGIRRTVRGKLPGAYVCDGTFQWTSAVQALSVLVLRTRSSWTAGKPQETVLEGTGGSLAASLDYALDKEPKWLEAFFGNDSSGNLLAKRLFLRSNPGRKRLGPVALRFNHRFLEPSAIQIVKNGQDCLMAAETECMAKQIEEQFCQGATKSRIIPSLVPLAA